MPLSHAIEVSPTFFYRGEFAMDAVRISFDRLACMDGAEWLSREYLWALARAITETPFAELNWGLSDTMESRYYNYGKKIKAEGAYQCFLQEEGGTQ